MAIDKSGKTWIGEGAKRMRSLPRNYGLSPEKNLFTTPKTKSACGSDTIAHPRNTTTPARSPGISCAFSPKAHARKVSGHAAVTVTATPPADEPVPEDSFL